MPEANDSTHSELYAQELEELVNLRLDQELPEAAFATVYEDLADLIATCVRLYIGLRGIEDRVSSGEF